MSSVTRLVIIGSGPAGLTAAIYASRANLKPIVIDGDQPGGQLMGTSLVENWPGESSIMGPQLMIKMRSQAEALGAQFVPGTLASVNLDKRPFILTTSKGLHLQAHCIIIATGASPLRLKCPGEDQYWGKGVTTCAVCDGAFYKDKKVIIVGGGDTAMEDASFMTKFTKDITIVHIQDKLTACAAMQERVLGNPDIKIIYDSTVTEITGNGSHVTGATITHQKTNQKSQVAVDGIFVAIGLRPNTLAFKDQLKLTPYGFVEVFDETKTSIEGVFAAGDVFDQRYRQAITAAGSGCKAALDAERYLKNII